MTATALYTLVAAGAVLGGYALYRSQKSEGHRTAAGYATGWDHSVVDYQNAADAVTDMRFERNYFERPYEIFCPGGELRPYEIDAHGQPTGRQIVMPGESPTVGNPADYIMVGFHPHAHGFHPHYGQALAMEQAALAEAEAEQLAAAQMGTMGEYATGALTPFQMMRLRQLMGGGRGGRHQQQQQQQMMQQQMMLQQQLMAAQQAAADAAQQAADAQQQALLAASTPAVDPTLAADPSLAAAMGEYATGAMNPYALMRLRQLMGGGRGGGYQQQQMMQQMQQQQMMLQQQLAAAQQAAADAVAAQQAALAAQATPLDPSLGGAGV